MDLIKLEGTAIHRCTFGATSLTIPEDISFEAWWEVVARIDAIHESSGFWLGDALLYGERKFGETYTQIAEATNYSVTKISLAVSVAKAFPPERRTWKVSYTHYCEAYYLPEEEREAALTEAEAAGWTAREMRQAARMSRISRTTADLSPVKREYHLAYAEWQPIAHRLRRYGEEHPTVRDEVDDLVTRLDRILQDGMKGKK